MSPHSRQPSYDNMKRRLEGGTPARDAGGRDAARLDPIVSPLEGAYLQDARGRAGEVLLEREAASQVEISLLLAVMQDNPTVAVREHPVDGCRLIEEDRRAEVEGILQAQGPLLTVDSQARDAARQAYQRDLQRADHDEPRGGWMSVQHFWKMVLLSVSIDIGLAFAVLVQAIGGPLAIVHAVVAVAVMSGGGVLSAALTLAPADARRRGTAGWWLQRLAALLIGGAVLAVLYVVMAMRSCLIEGLTTTPAEILARALRPLEVLASAESLGLAVAGLVAFAVAVWETRAFFHGVERSLRRSGLAWEAARDAVMTRRNAAGRAVEAAVNAGRDRMTCVGAAYRSWAITASQVTDRAAAQINAHNRLAELVQSALEGLEADYHAGFAEVRVGGAPPRSPTPIVADPLVLPQGFRDARTLMIDLGAEAAEVVRRAQETLSMLRAEAMAMIDHLAGVKTLPLSNDDQPRPPNPFRLSRAA